MNSVGKKTLRAKTVSAPPHIKRLAAQEILRELLVTDLGFHAADSSAMSHDFHAFPAKFPPQLPHAFIQRLTQPDDYVLDPMMGSGTTIVEALASQRVGIGFDIDPLAVLLCRVKTQCLDPDAMETLGLQIADNAEQTLSKKNKRLEAERARRFDPKTQEFIDYWFEPQTQLELLALLGEIEQIEVAAVREFFQLVLSAIIITKSGGVSLAWDLAHTRPHKLKQGEPKIYKPAFKEFRKRLLKNVASLNTLPRGVAWTQFGNAEALPLADNSMDLLFTSPPYASNAIDYMRAHKFSLAWFGHPVETLSNLRSKYIGGEKTANYAFVDLPPATVAIVKQISDLDSKKGLALQRYYSEMWRVLEQALRVLKPGKAAVFVVGSSVMRGIDTQTQHCLGEIGAAVGLELVGIATRQLDRDRRMMPARTGQRQSLIEERMHEEYVVAFVKPEYRSNGHGAY